MQTGVNEEEKKSTAGFCLKCNNVVDPIKVYHWSGEPLCLNCYPLHTSNHCENYTKHGKDAFAARYHRNEKGAIAHPGTGGTPRLFRCPGCADEAVEYEEMEAAVEGRRPHIWPRGDGEKVVKPGTSSSSGDDPLTTCYGCEGEFRESDITRDTDDDPFCDDCLGDHRQCPGCSGWVFVDSAMVDNTGSGESKWWCDECYTERHMADCESCLEGVLNHQSWRKTVSGGYVHQGCEHNVCEACNKALVDDDESYAVYGGPLNAAIVCEPCYNKDDNLVGVCEDCCEAIHVTKHADWVEDGVMCTNCAPEEE